MSACITALAAAVSSTGQATGTLTQLSGALDAAAAALQQQQSNAALQSSGTALGSSGGTTASGTGSTAGAQSVGGQSAGSTASLEVQVLKATQQLASAQQDLDGATLTAPISGTVAQLDLAVGEQATSSSQLVVVGHGAAAVTVDLPLAQLGQVRVAQAVTVTPAGTTTAVDGVVESIGVLPSSTTSSSPSYPVVVTVSDAPVSLATGSTASASIELAKADSVLTVPVSAVSGLSSGEGEVSVVSNGAVSRVRVTVGAVGGGLAQVDSGLTQGQRVVVADPSEPLPTSSSGLRGGLGGDRPGFDGGPDGPG